uniref:Uncharacterized protein n=1 Tax=Tanacetum cinerariifolium TaxID=118510 RepID=A0A6L2NMR4_TANCI|nr:hypothetical protein [Tanacetum cinerariifolium]
MGDAPVQAPPYIPKPKNPPTPKKENPAMDVICHQCGKGLRGSRKLKTRALILYVGDGHRAAIKAIREFHLCLPNRLVLIFHNCHYAPSITKGIISVLRLYKDGFVNLFKNDNSISVSKDNVIYFNAILRDDIYETYLSSSNTNDSCKYTSQEFLDYLKEHGIIAHRTPRYPSQHHENSLITQEASGSPEDLEIIQEDDMHPFIFTSLNHKEDDQEIDDSQSYINPIWDLGEPANYKAALLDPESEKWLNAMNVEMYGYCKNHKKRANGQKRTWERKEYTRARNLSSKVNKSQPWSTHVKTKP